MSPSRATGTKRKTSPPSLAIARKHQMMLEWLGLDNASEFDPAAIPTDTINGELALSGANR
jgi:hypothetical protein